MKEATNPEELSKKAKEASTEVKETASAAVEQARSTLQAAWQEAKNNTSVLQTYTREHPARAVLVALGMGIVLGRFLRR
jgi:ElaB/YqjD/DUF883 family membrane-anchored ribosome-binding protein